MRQDLEAGMSLQPRLQISRSNLWCGGGGGGGSSGGGGGGGGAGGGSLYSFWLGSYGGFKASI